MKRFLAWVLGLPAAIVLVAFAIANRQFVTVSLDPISPQDPWIAVRLPLWSLLYIGIFIGLVTGWLAAWINQHHWRKEARRSRQELERTRVREEERERAERRNQLTPLDG
jgi:uncharacterized membrane protein YidH (DUF202 family)